LFAKTTLDNGVRVVTERMDSVRSVSIGIWVNAGSRDEPWERAGISHVLEHMIFKGTERRSALDIAKEIDAIGGLSNAFTSKEQTCFHAKVLDSHLDVIVELLADIFLNSIFSPQELEKEQEVVLQEIRLVEDTPDDLVHLLMPGLLWPENPLGRSVLGRVDSVAGLDSQVLKSYIRTAYRPESIVIAASGALEHGRLVELINPSLGQLPGLNGRENRFSPQAGPGQLLQEKDLEQVHLCLGMEGVSAVSPERFAGALLNVLLGGSMSSVLFQEIREKRGLAYAVYSYLGSHSDAGLLGIYLGVEPKRSREALKVVLEVMAEFSHQGVSAEVLDKAKEHLKGSIFLAAESTDNRMNRVAKNEFHFGRYIPFDEIARNIDATTPEDVTGLAARLLDPSRMALVALGPGVEKRFGSGWYRK